jgi:hypothetical protein
MTHIETENERIEAPDRFDLWVVLIDTNCGQRAADWAENSEPKPLPAALDESCELQREGWITRLEPTF